MTARIFSPEFFFHGYIQIAIGISQQILNSLADLILILSNSYRDDPVLLHLKLCVFVESIEFFKKHRFVIIQGLQHKFPKKGETIGFEKRNPRWLL